MSLAREDPGIAHLIEFPCLVVGLERFEHLLRRLKRRNLCKNIVSSNLRSMAC